MAFPRIANEPILTGVFKTELTAGLIQANADGAREVEAAGLGCHGHANRLVWIRGEQGRREPTRFGAENQGVAWPELGLVQ